MRFAFRTSGDKRVASWLAKVGGRLGGGEGFSFLRGRVKSLGDGLFVMEVLPFYPRFVANAILVFLFAAGLVLSVYFPTLAFFVFVFASASFVILNAFWSPALYMALVLVQSRRMTGAWVKVRRAESEVLELVLDGKV